MERSFELTVAIRAGQLPWYKIADYTGIISTMAMKPETQRRALGDFLRTHRMRLSPAGLGLASGGRRRTPGLRREEVAQTCGMSTTWYTWLEQGRDVSPSPRALARLAETLRLTPAERAYLFRLAGKSDPTAPSPVGNGMDAPTVLTEAVAAIAAPAYVLDQAWNARAWNTPAKRLFVGWLDGQNDRNLLRYVFLSPLARRVLPDWEKRARRVLAEFRADSGRYLDDAHLKTLVEGLSQQSPFFARCWQEHEVEERAGGERSFDHPRKGRLRYEQVAFTLASRADLKLVILTPRSGRKQRKIVG
jgi:transcriptional regulator with XRE-family HTH domain